MRKEHNSKRSRHLRVPVLPDEEAAIKKQAAAAGLSVAAYLRSVGMGYEIKSTLDHRRVDDMARINGDLGRLGGLLKLWLTNDAKLKQFNAARMRQTITAVLNKITQNQNTLRDIMRTVLRS